MITLGGGVELASGFGVCQNESSMNTAFSASVRRSQIG